MKYTTSMGGTPHIMDTGHPDPGCKASEHGQHHSGEAWRSFTPQYNNPRHQNTVANQAYTFNGTTPNTSVSYAPGTFNMGALFCMYQVPYNQQQSQTYTQNHQYHNNLFADKQNNQTLCSQMQQHSSRNYNSCY